MIRKQIAKLAEAIRDTRNDPNLPEVEVRLTTTIMKEEIQHLTKDTHQYN